MTAQAAARAVNPMGAALSVLAGAAVLGLIDNFVILIAAEGSLWQFHATRTAMALPIMVAIALLGWGRLRPNRPIAVLCRSALSATAMLIYFASLALFPTTVAAAGLFTSPIFVVILSWALLRRPVGWRRWGAVLVGFVGVLLVIGPTGDDFGPGSLFPVLAGLFYAAGALATREWCEGEGTLSLTAGFFLMLGLMGLTGLGVLALWPVDAPLGADGFAFRGMGAATPGFLFWTAVQAVGSLIGVAALFRGYQLGEASHVAIFEYSFLIFITAWGFVLYSTVPGVAALAGIALILVSGAVISLRSGA